MLEGAVPRQAIRTCSFDASPARRYAALMADEFAATVLQEPWITVAEKAGCRLVSTTFFYGTWVADATMDGDTYAAFVRASTAAVQRINADKRRYLHYFTREYAGYAEVEALTPDDFNPGRIQLKIPEPIPEADARWDWEWMASWDLLDGAFDATAQINTTIQRAAHAGH
jgi:hypothetical protein